MGLTSPVESDPNVWQTLAGQFLLIGGIIVVLNVFNRSGRTARILRTLGIGVLVGFTSWFATSFVLGLIQSPSAFWAYMQAPFPPRPPHAPPDFESPPTKLEFAFYAVMAVATVCWLSSLVVVNLVRASLRQVTRATLAAWLGIGVALVSGAGAAVILVTSGRLNLF